MATVNYWNVDSENGNELAAGIQDYSVARWIAQRHADRLGAPVTLYQPGGETEEVEPTSVNASA